MAIIKPVQTPQGVLATYHKVLRAEIDATNLVMTIIVAIYASEEARTDGRNVLWHEYVQVPFSALTQDPRDLLYPLLAAFGSSFLRGGVPDSTMEGFEQPGNTTITLTPEAMELPAPPLAPPEPVPEPAPASP